MAFGQVGGDRRGRARSGGEESLQRPHIRLLTREMHLLKCTC